MEVYGHGGDIMGLQVMSMDHVFVVPLVGLQSREPHVRTT